jgi:hypothetical protein
MRTGLLLSTGQRQGGREGLRRGRGASGFSKTEAVRKIARSEPNVDYKEEHGHMSLSICNHVLNGIGEPTFHFRV